MTRVSSDADSSSPPTVQPSDEPPIQAKSWTATSSEPSSLRHSPEPHHTNSSDSKCLLFQVAKFGVLYYATIDS